MVSSVSRRCLVLVAVIALASAIATIAQAQGGQVFLPVTQHGFQPGVPSEASLSLIAEAEQAGSITHEQALTYSVYALFGDSRLPSQFRGRASEDSQVMAHIAAEWNGLSAEARTALAPFMLPPNAAGSWTELGTVGAQALDSQTVEWRTVSTASGVKVWYQTRFAGDDVKARGLATAIDSRIFSRLQGLMARPWLPDAGLTNNGGDALLDIYLVRGPKVDYYGLATPYTDCEESPVWINLDSNRPLGDETHAGIIQSAAHEMMHAVQFSYPLKDACATYDWLAEATAKWFEHYTYRDAQSEQPYAPWYLKTAYWPLENTANDRQYGAYLYPFFVTEKVGHADSVRRMYENAGTMDSLRAVNDGGASFSNYWMDFARYNWNQGPVTEYQTWDGLSSHAEHFSPDIFVTPGGGLFEWKLPARLEHLTATYYHFRFNDDSARSVMFYNGVTFEMSEKPAPWYTGDIYLQGEMLPWEQREGISVQALYKIEGDSEWKSEDWTWEESAGFCRDAAAERIEELVLIFANGEYDKDKPDYDFTPIGTGAELIVSDIGCWRWQGTITATGLDPDYTTDVIDVTRVTLQRNTDSFGEYNYYSVVDGQGTVNWRRDDPEGVDWAHTDGAQPFSLAGTVADNLLLVTNNLVTGGPRARGYYSDPLYCSARYTYHWFFEDREDSNQPYDHPTQADVGYLLVLPMWYQAGVKTLDDGAVMQGSVTISDVRFEYDLEAKREGE
jgi:hypothetical protein